MKTIEIPKSHMLYMAIAYAKTNCKEQGEPCVQFIFNDILLKVFEMSVVEDIAEIYRLKRKCGEYEK